MTCAFAELCGGCVYRQLSINEYQEKKRANFEAILRGLKTNNYKLNDPIFIPDGCRRRAELTFRYNKKGLIFGFNCSGSHDIVDIDHCALLTPELNSVLEFTRNLLEQLCTEPFKLKKGKKINTYYLNSGDVFLCQATNGIDMVLEFDAQLELNHRMIICEAANLTNAPIRITHRRRVEDIPETIIEHSKPYIKAGDFDVLIPAGTFLQPSAEGQQALGQLVQNYLKGIKGEIADLFCGVGTFSYMLAGQNDVKITAIDSSKSLLQGFQNSLNYNRLTNITIKAANLFKYPPTTEEIAKFRAVIFDPPRAGAAEVCRMLAVAEKKPEIVIAISCNPATFVNDANTLLAGGYRLEEITMVDQFVYSNHSELVACFTKEAS